MAGAPIAELSLVPPLFVSRSVAALGRAEPLPADRRTAALTAAAEAFVGGVVAGLTVEEYQRAVSRVSGMPISVVRGAVRALAYSATMAGTSAHSARPAGSVGDWRDPATRDGRAVWVRRGEVFAVHAAGNHPGVHAPWLEALALGYRVVVRPSRREPFTAHRLITALREAGFGDDHVVLLPTDHAVADEIIRAADLSMVYGSADVVAKYAADPTVLPQGPGRSKILLTAADHWHSYLDTVVESVGGHAGMACHNISAVFVEGDPGPVARAVAERLGDAPSLPPEHDKAVLPVQPVDVARRIERHLLRHAKGCVPWLGGSGVVDELGDGSAVLRPAVIQVDRPDAPQTAVEFGFPCVWVAPWSRSAGIEPLRRTLVLTVSAPDDELVDRLLGEPSIGNVYVGNNPTLWLEPGIPHDGYLGEFLMRSKAMIRR
ncbi:aldehyde dehydrogenase family protein [Actinoallomurus sp. NPDC052274]|uniref:aldehyde dehydrogenase family protein n=1 Tax=Actinoallomurus sp. NPDC052274 TaxID=3155420 RepID=UPI0034169DC9